MLQYRVGGGGGGGGGAGHCEIVTSNCPGYCGCLLCCKWLYIFQGVLTRKSRGATTIEKQCIASKSRGATAPFEPPPFPTPLLSTLSFSEQCSLTIIVCYGDGCRWIIDSCNVAHCR